MRGCFGYWNPELIDAILTAGFRRQPRNDGSVRARLEAIMADAIRAGFAGPRINASLDPVGITAIALCGRIVHMTTTIPICGETCGCTADARARRRADLAEASG